MTHQGSGLRRRAVLQALPGLALAGGAGAVHAQAFPSRNITMILPGAAGTPSDLVGRHLAASMATQAGVAVVADNRPGANGIIGVQAVLNAPADGHTMLFTTMSTVAVNKALIKNLPYEPMTDLITLGSMFRTWLYVTMSAKLPFKTLPELVSAAKKEPGKYNFGYATSIPQMAGKLFEQRSGTQYTFVAYKTHTAMIQAVAAGEIDLTITDPLSFAGVHKAGLVRPLAATSPTRMASFSDVPTLAEAGVPNYELGSAHIAMVRAGTPPAVVARLIEMLTNASRSRELQAFLAQNNLDNFFVTGTEATRYVAGEVDRWGTIARGAGLQPS